MKFSKMLMLLVAVILMFGALAACGSAEEPAPAPAQEEPAPAEPAPAEAEPAPAEPAPAEATPAPTPPPAPEEAAWYEAYGLDENLRFIDTRSITVEVYNRNNDGGSDPTNNFYTNWIKEQMLAKHNVDVSFVAVTRFPEEEEINNLLAAGDAPDICVTYNGPTIQNYANQDAVINLAEYFDDPNSSGLFPNIWNLVGGSNIYWSQDVDTGALWQIEGFRVETAKTSTFVREDWLAALSLEKPTDINEFEAMLVAFKDNAELLLGEKAVDIIPLMMTYDTGWNTMTILESFLPEDITDKDMTVYGFDDRRIMFDTTKEALRVVNKWYNMGLIWQDFAMYGPEDSTGMNFLKAGVVGATIENWDMPYRNGEDSYNFNMQKTYPGAAFVAVDTFKNDAGLYRKYMYNPSGTDRKVFFPYTNDEPLASLMYLDFLCEFDTYNFLQIGEEGVTHNVLEDGTIQTVGVTGEKIMNSPNNIDYTMLMNGLNLATPEDTAKALAVGYANIEPEYVITSRTIAMNDGKILGNPRLGPIAAEEGIGVVLNDKRNVVFNQAVTVPEAEFDSVYDAGVADYLASGGQAIIDERLEKWEALYGAETMLPAN